jgi:peptide deformylase
MLYIVLSETMKMVIDVAIRNIMVFPKDEVLRKKSRKVEKISKKILTLLDDMAETMYAANGAGLAAVQIGILRRVVVIDDGTGLLRLINPVIAASSGEQQEIEGCLSIPGIAGRVNPAPCRLLFRRSMSRDNPSSWKAPVCWHVLFVMKLTTWTGFCLSAKPYRVLCSSAILLSRRIAE